MPVSVLCIYLLWCLGKKTSDTNTPSSSLEMVRNLWAYLIKGFASILRLCLLLKIYIKKKKYNPKTPKPTFFEIPHFLFVCFVWILGRLVEVIFMAAPFKENLSRCKCDVYKTQRKSVYLKFC